MRFHAFSSAKIKSEFVRPNSILKVRALTYFVKPRRWSEEILRRGIEKAEGILSELERKVNEFIEVWTLRIAMPPSPQRIELEQLLDVAPDKKFLYAALHLDANDPRLAKLPELLAKSNAYGSIKVKRRDDVGAAVRAILELSAMDYEACTRLAVIFGKRESTPYFPAASTCTQEGVAVALLYVNEADRDMGSGIWLPRRLGELGRFLEAEVERLGSKFLGFDLSLSPWMSESTAGLVEKVSRVKLPLPGTLEAISRINEYIRDLGLFSGVRTIGFNELMLPVGEDDVLKERVLSGEVQLEDLARFASVCVAGVDMVAVERGWAEKWLNGYMLDLFEVSRVKRRTMGVRILPVRAEAGSTVEFKRFGKIPVARGRGS